jgi:hypothetical protein
VSLTLVFGPAIVTGLALRGLPAGCQQALALRWEDVDLACGRLVVRQQLVQIGGRHACPYCAQLPPRGASFVRDHLTRLPIEGNGARVASASLPLLPTGCRLCACRVPPEDIEQRACPDCRHERFFHDA